MMLLSVLVEKLFLAWGWGRGDFSRVGRCLLRALSFSPGEMVSQPRANRNVFSCGAANVNQFLVVIECIDSVVIWGVINIFLREAIAVATYWHMGSPFEG